MKCIWNQVHPHLEPKPPSLITFFFILMLPLKSSPTTSVCELQGRLSFETLIPSTLCFNPEIWLRMRSS